MKKRIPLILVCILFFLNHQTISAQDFHKLGIGMDFGGYRLNNSSIYTEYFYKRVAIDAEYIQNGSSGSGYSFSINYFQPLKQNTQRTLAAFAGLAFTRMFGVTQGYETTPDQFTDYKVGGADYLIPLLGLRYTAFGIMDRDTYIRKGGVALFIRAGYRFFIGDKPTVVLSSGAPYEAKQRTLRRAANEGIGASVGGVIFLGKKQKK